MAADRRRVCICCSLERGKRLYLSVHASIAGDQRDSCSHYVMATAQAHKATIWLVEPHRPLGGPSVSTVTIRVDGNRDGL